MLDKLFILSAISTYTITALAGENLLYNAGFDLGTAGYADERFIDAKTNPNLDYIPLQIDELPNYGKTLLIKNPYAEMLRLYVREVELKPNTLYTFSFALKSDVANEPFRLFVDSCYIPKGKGEDAQSEFKQNANFESTKEWKRYSFSFTTDSNATLRFCNFRLEFAFKYDAKPANIWLDNFNLSEGKSTEYSPAGELVMSVESSEKLYTKTTKPSEAELHVLLFNNTASERKETIVLTIRNDTTGEVVTEFKRPVIIPAGNKTIYTEKIPLTQYGAYNLALTAEGRDHHTLRSFPGYYAVIGQYHAGKVDLMKDFVVGIDGGAGYVRNMGPRPGYRSCGLGAKERMALFAVMGCRLMRDWGHTRGFKWMDIEPEAGKYDFMLPDRMLNLCEKNNIAVMPVLGGWEFLQLWPTSSFTNFPKWLQDKSKTIPDSELPIPLLKRWPALKVQLPPLEDWQRMIAALAERYKGRITYWEIFNEPNFGGGEGCLPAATYMPYLKTAAETLRKISPEAKVVGFSATGDFGGRLGTFLENCFKSGGLPYADIVSFHPYSDRQYGKADVLIARLKELIHKYSPDRKIPLWNTELYYLHGNESNFEAGFFKPKHLATRFLLDLGEGVGQGTYFNYDFLFKNLIAPDFPSIKVLYLESRPSDNFVVFNSLARLFEAAKPQGKILLPDNTVAYLYKKNGKIQVALWNTGKADDLLFDLKSAKTASLKTDLFGNPYTADIKIAFSDSPIYLFYDNDDLKAISAEIKALAIAPRNPVTARQQLELPSGGSIELRINRQEQVKIGWEATDVHSPSQWHGAADSSATVKLTRNGRKVNFKIQVTDNQVLTAPDREPYDQDGVELFYAPLTDSKVTERGQIVVRADGKVFPMSKSVLPDFQVKSERNAQGYVLAGSFTLPETALKQHAMLFDVAIDDADAGDSGRRTQIIWAGTTDNHLSAAKYGIISLP